jgi:hypothetical protein
VGIFPDRASIIRLVGSLLIGETEECAEQHRYVSAEALAKVQRVGSPTLELSPTTARNTLSRRR